MSRTSLNEYANHESPHHYKNIKSIYIIRVYYVGFHRRSCSFGWRSSRTVAPHLRSGWPSTWLLGDKVPHISYGSVGTSDSSECPRKFSRLDGCPPRALYQTIPRTHHL